MRKILLTIGLVLSLGLVFVGAGREYGPTVLSWIGQTANDPVSLVVVIESTDHPTKLRDVTMGPTANALRKAKKWRQWDEDQVPKEFMALRDAAAEEQKNPDTEWQPWLFILHGTKVTWSDPLPETDALLLERINSQGGM
jgi:hypothetical protein